MMTVRSDDDTTAEAGSPSVTVGISVTVTIGGGGVLDINPSLGHFTVHRPLYLLVRRTPGEPDRGLRHTGCDLALSNELLRARRQAGIEVAMLRNARFGGGTSGKEHRAGGNNGRQRPGEKSTLNHNKKSYKDAMVSQSWPILDSTPAQP